MTQINCETNDFGPYNVLFSEKMATNCYGVYMTGNEWNIFKIHVIPNKPQAKDLVAKAISKISML